VFRDGGEVGILHVLDQVWFLLQRRLPAAGMGVKFVKELSEGRVERLLLRQHAARYFRQSAWSLR
jgi:hypothetical protein